MAIEIVDFPIKNCDFPVRYVKLPEGTQPGDRVGFVPKTRHFRAKTEEITEMASQERPLWSVNLGLLLMETPSLLIEKHSLIRWICSRLLVFHGNNI